MVRVRIFRSTRALSALGIIIATLALGQASYTVQPGDTLSSIAVELGLTVGELAELNDLSDINVIHPGQTLLTGDSHTDSDLSHDRHVVKPGESLTGIASRHGVTVGQLRRANGLVDGETLLASVSLRLRVDGDPFDPTIESVAHHLASTGDHVAEIAQGHNVPESTLRRLNGLTDDHVQSTQNLVLGLSWTCPVDGGAFNNDWGVVKPDGRIHEGVDVFAQRGTPIVAPVSGHVHQVTSNRGGLSFLLVGDDGWTYYGAHMDSVGVSGSIGAGATLGTVGDSGNAVGSPPHLHLEVWRGAEPTQNPYPALIGACR